jgi:hypothetical protein
MFRGCLEELRVVVYSRLTAPSPPATADTVLNVSEAAEQLGASPQYLYRKHSKFEFTRRMGRSLLFSAHGIDRYIRETASLEPASGPRYSDRNRDRRCSRRTSFLSDVAVESAKSSLHNLKRQRDCNAAAKRRRPSRAGTLLRSSLRTSPYS